MMQETQKFGAKLASKETIPEWIQVTIGIGAMLLFVAAWQLDVASVFILIPATGGIMISLCVIAHFIPALRSSITVYEHGLELVVQEKLSAFRFDQLNSMSAKLTHHEMKHQYVGSMARIEFFVDGRFGPHIYDYEFRRGNYSEKVLALAIEKCSQAIQHRLLVELEREGAVRWRDNVSLTAEGILLTDPTLPSRLIPYREIGEWKIVDNDLKIWKAGDALPCLVFGNESPNFFPLCRLFESLCNATRNIEPDCAMEPELVGRA